jgi:hypothetical protein
MNRHADLSGACEDCKPRALARNHYFTGKLLVERDFTDEQWFFREKIRLHHQRLHGTGVVCGLEIRQYPNANCQGRLVLLRPGSAVDCCGHDILVAHEETFDITTVPAVNALIQANDTKTHVLEFCLSWRECPTEEIPVLFDECGCDDTQCAPNRILESFSLDVIVDPPLPPAQVASPKLNWGSSINIAQPIAVALDEKNERLYVVTAGPNSTVYQYDTQHFVLGQPSLPLGRTALDLAVSPDGDLLYVAVLGAQPADPSQIFVFDVSGGLPSSAAPAATLTLGAAPETSIALTVASDGQVLVAAPVSGDLWLLAAGKPAQDATVNGPLGTGARSTGAFSSDGKSAWFATGGAALVHADLTTSPISLSTVNVTGATPFASSAVAVSSTGSGADTLVVLDHTNKTLSLVPTVTVTNALAVTASVALNDPPVSLLIAPGGGYAVVTSEQDLQTVNLVALANGTPNPASGDLALPATIGRFAMTASGLRLYVPYSGVAGPPPTGAVAVIDITSSNCRDLLLAGDCPSCDAPDCVVLARVENWTVGDKLEDTLDPPSSASADAAAGIARIDNGARTVLASTQAITQALICLMDNGTGGGGGGVGPVGPAGPPGPTGQTGATGLRGPAGPSGLNPNLTGICAISWLHNGRMTLETPLVIAFSAPVQSADLTTQSIRLLAPFNPSGSSPPTMIAWGEVPLTLQPTMLGTTCIISSGTSPAGSTCDAVELSFDVSSVIKALEAAGGSNPLRVEVHGDLIRDTQNQPVALDGNHLPPWLGSSSSYKTGDGVAGGLFESWFTVPL